VRPLTPAGQQFLDETAPEDAQFMGDAMVVEPRYVGRRARGGSSTWTRMNLAYFLLLLALGLTRRTTIRKFAARWSRVPKERTGGSRVSKSTFKMHKDGCIEILRPLKPHPELKDPRLKGKKRIRQNLLGQLERIPGHKESSQLWNRQHSRKDWMNEP
jgi:hypothetical protein